jgi:hypothetical protein
MEITQEYDVDCTSQRMVIVKEEIGICLKGEVGQFSSLIIGDCTLFVPINVNQINFHIFFYFSLYL